MSEANNSQTIIEELLSYDYSFSEKTFAVLSDYDSASQEEIENYLEKPFKKLCYQVIAQLPGAIAKRLDLSEVNLNYEIVNNENRKRCEFNLFNKGNDLNKKETRFFICISSEAASEEYQTAKQQYRTAKPYHLVLDEMNLARIEYYFAKFLSAIEVKMRQETAEIELAANEKVLLTPNLHVIGTVNMDETTFEFSNKVSDPAGI